MARVRKNQPSVYGMLDGVLAAHPTLGHAALQTFDSVLVATQLRNQYAENSNSRSARKRAVTAKRQANEALADLGVKAFDIAGGDLLIYMGLMAENAKPDATKGVIEEKARLVGSAVAFSAVRHLKTREERTAAELETLDELYALGATEFLKDELEQFAGIKPETSEVERNLSIRIRMQKSAVEMEMEARKAQPIRTNRDVSNQGQERISAESFQQADAEFRLFYYAGLIAPEALPTWSKLAETTPTTRQLVPPISVPDLV